MQDTARPTPQARPPTDPITRIADRRCPDCGTRQPLYVAVGGGPAFLRSGRLAVPCPGCGVALRVLDSTTDPHGILGAVVMVLGGTAGIIAVVISAAEQDWGEGVLLAGLVAGVMAMAAFGILWTLLRARLREVVRADDTNGTETRP